ncbi:MAG: type II toxin-antitoxin system Phd/YefM family antitoxin [Alkalispirochaeta sp.]
MKTWNATDAKRHFSQVLSGAETTPQVVLLRGKPVGVVVSYDRYVRSEEQTANRTVSDWLRDLDSLRQNEPGMAVAERTDRPDQFGDDWK